MFEKLSLLWKNEAPLTQEYKEFDEMLQLDLQMFRRITEAMLKGEDLRPLENEIYETDVKVNKLERKIRKALVTHLAVTEGADVASSLVLMSIVKDAERMGDYCKNLYELSECTSGPITGFQFFATIQDLIRHVTEVFENTIKAFDTEDSVLAAEIVADEVRWNKRFDKTIRDLARATLPTDEAVTSALLVRMMKRQQAHLSNITSTIIQPVHRIDHRPKHLRDNAAKTPSGEDGEDIS